MQSQSWPSAPHKGSTLAHRAALLHFRHEHTLRQPRSSRRLCLNHFPRREQRFLHAALLRLLGQTVGVNVDDVDDGGVWEDGGVCMPSRITVGGCSVPSSTGGLLLDVTGWGNPSATDGAESSPASASGHPTIAVTNSKAVAVRRDIIMVCSCLGSDTGNVCWPLPPIADKRSRQILEELLGWPVAFSPSWCCQWFARPRSAKIER